MEITSRQRGAKLGRTISFSDKKCNINFDLNIFSMLCNYCVSSNKNIRRSDLIMLRNLIDAMNMDLFINEPEKIARIDFIKRALEIRIQHGNINRVLLIQGAMDGLTGETKFSMDDFFELQTNELDFINEMISGALKSTYLENSIEEMSAIVTAFKSHDYRNRSEITEWYEDFIRRENSRLRAAARRSVTETVFDLREDHFETALYDIHERISATYRRIYTGMQGFNMLIGDAFEATRTYLILGTAGVGKSLTALDIAMQVKKYNPGFICKDPTKIPTVLYLTQENDVDETVERIFSMVSHGKRMRDYSKEEIKEILLRDGELNLTGDNNINIMIMYKPDKSIDTGDLYTIAEDLEDDGYELIMLIQDHVKRIRSVLKERRQDLRIELGEVMNEFKVFAQIKQIPVITIGHLNRSANQTIENGMLHNTADITKLLGRSTVGESLLMIDNADCVLLINKDFDKDMNPYLCINQLKLRCAMQGNRTYICQPYELDAPRLVADLYDEPVFRESLLSQAQMKANASSIKNKVMHTIYDDDDEYDDDVDDVQNIAANNMFGNQFLPNGTIPLTSNMFNMSSASTSYDMEASYDEQVINPNDAFTTVLYPEALCTYIK